MDFFVSRKRRKVSGQHDDTNTAGKALPSRESQSIDTDEKLAILASIFEDISHEVLLNALIDNDGNVEAAIEALLNPPPLSSTKSPTTKTATVFQSSRNVQSSLKFSDSTPEQLSPSTQRPLTRKGKTITLFSPAQIAQHTPCTLIHPFLPPDLANRLLTELLPETTTFTSATFRLFDNIVQSPHTACFYVNSLADAEAQKSDFLYNGSTLSDVREILPTMREVSKFIEATVPTEIAKQIIAKSPGGKKPKYQAPPELWKPNAAFVNCYDGPQQSVGWHTDQLTYLGPHPTIASLSLGVQREFRIRRIVPPPESDPEWEQMSEAERKKLVEEAGDMQGQISIPLPHNSLLLMHANCQEEWKHSVSSARSIQPHGVAGGKRVNITYRWYREEFEPRFTPRCRCKVKVKRRRKKSSEDGDGWAEEEVEEGVPCVLKSVMRRKETLGKYVWMCQTPGRVGIEEGIGKAEGVAKGCGFFEWAEFDEDGAPLELEKFQVTRSLS